MKILVLNCGSSSLRYQLIEMKTKSVLAKGYYEKIGVSGSFLNHAWKDEKIVIENEVENHREAIDFVINKLISNEHGVINSMDEINAIGHRIVHGGEFFAQSVLVTDDVINSISECSDLAPLHNPAHLIGIKACRSIMPETPMVVVFDTAFHQTIPQKAYIYALPHEYYSQYKVRRYGFHGTSHKYVSKRLAQIMNKDINNLKIISCHLGQGGSICAIDSGKSVDTSMGLTPLAGIIMGTRSGDIDPAILKYIMKKTDMTIDELENILNKKSGLLGISGVSNDMRDVRKEASEGNQRAQLAIDAFCYGVAKYIGSYAMAMNGLDAVIFTAGIGENVGSIRAEICKYLKWLNVSIDEAKNNSSAQEMQISTQDSPIKIFVIPTNEELMIAEDTLNIINNLE